MDDLYFNLAKEEFSKARKILLWVIAFIAGTMAVWDTYLKFFKQDIYSAIGLTITLYVVTAFLFMIAILSTKKRKEQFFKVDYEVLSYRYGLLFPSHQEYTWEEIDKIYFPPHSKNMVLVQKDGKVVHINLTWVEKNKSRMIRKHVFYTGKDKGVGIVKSHYKK